MNGNAVDLAVRNNIVYVANGTNLAVVDVSIPSAPTLVKTLNTGGTVQSVALSPDSSKLYIADSQGFKVASLSNPRSPTLGGSVSLPGGSVGIAVSGTLAFVAQTSKLAIIDVSAPTPAIRASLTLEASGVAASGSFAYVASGNNGVQVINASNPASPFIAGKTNVDMAAHGVSIHGNYLFVADEGFVNSAIPIFNISDPASPAYVGLIVPDGNRVHHGRIDANNNLVFTVGEGTILQIGMYAPQDPPTPPVAALTSPAAGADVADGGLITMSAQASDTIGVQKVDFLVNGIAQASVAKPPYLASVRLPVGKIGQTLTLGVRATNLSNIPSTVDTVQVNDVSDPLTTVTGRTVRSDGTAIPGAFVSAFSSITTTSQADGSFALYGIPTLLGDVPIAALFQTTAAVLSAKFSTAPVSGGVIDLGELVLTSSGSTIGGVVSGELTPAQSPYSVVADLIVPQGQTLTIDAGVALKMAGGVNIQVDGTLIVNGTPASNTYFTSLNDDAIGGHTGAGLSSVAEPGDWGNLTFTPTSTNCVVNSAVIRYGAGALLQAASPTFNGTSFTLNQTAMKMDVNSFPTGQGNQAFGNTPRPNTFGIPSFNGIVIDGSTLLKSGTWGLAGIPFLLGVAADHDFQIGTGTTAAQLTIGPGVLVKLADNSSVLVNDSLNIAGTASQPASFTSLGDDSQGGPARPFAGSIGSWGMLQFFNTSAVSQISHAILRYGGSTFSQLPPGSGKAIVRVVGLSPIIRDSEISRGPIFGIRLESTAGSLDMSGTLIADNGDAGLSAEAMVGGKLILANNHFGNNSIGTNGGAPITINPNVFPVNNGGNVLDDRTTSEGIQGIRVVGGTMMSSGTWPALFPYYLSPGAVGGSDFFIGMGTTNVQWTIAAGTIIKVGNHTIHVNDSMRSLGTPTQPVTFTSDRDDLTGGQGYSDPRSPASWGGLFFLNTTIASVLQNTNIRYASPAGIDVFGLSPTVQGGLISNGFIDGIRLEANATPFEMIGTSIASSGGIGINAENMTRGEIILQNVDISGSGGFQDQSAAIQINPNVFPVDHGGNTLGPNGLRGIAVLGGTMRRSGTWPAMFPYYVNRGVGNLVIGNGDKSVQWTIDPGAIIKTGGGKAIVINDTMTAVGTHEQPIAFTSAFDEYFDGIFSISTHTFANPGDWGGLYFTPHFPDYTFSGSQLRHAFVRYSDVGITVDNVSPIFEHCEIANNASRGFSFLEQSISTVTFSTITISGIGIYASSNSVVLVSSNSIVGNSSFGLYFDDTGDTRPNYFFGAGSNWWGNKCGPTDPQNVEGCDLVIPNPVSAKVNYFPYLTQPPPEVGP